ncbi:hypothetical protein [Pseudocnuella soli]|uniref:hypothetical protein n=1 Tax=Pseudocnuella soli TaxID=2502779 RepID=UPI0010511E94|nr:hypothetical protein [Pseudocnuella soli]
MKRIVTGALALLLMTSAVQAQKTEDKRGRQKQGTEQLNLTADQQARLKTIREAHRKQWQELQKQDNITVKEWKARRQELTQKQRTEMAAVLTAEQQQKLAKMQGERRNGMQGKGFGQKRQPMANLNLTNEQQSKMKAVNESFREKRQALRTNSVIAENQKQEQLKELAQQHRQEVKAILTKEQQQRMETLRNERRHKNGK